MSMVPDEVRSAIRAELEADTAEYRDATPETGWTKPNRGSSPLLAFRLAPEALEQLQALAEAQGVSVSALARGFVLDGVAAARADDLKSALDRLERDLAAVKARALAS